MPKTSINLNQKVYDERGNPVKENSENVQSILQKLSRMDVASYKRADQLINDLAKNFSLKELKLEDYLKNLANLRIDKEEVSIEDFDLYLDIRNANKTIELDDVKIQRLQTKLKKSSFPTLIAGQIYYMLKGLENPLKK